MKSSCGPFYSYKRSCPAFCIAGGGDGSGGGGVAFDLYKRISWYTPAWAPAVTWLDCRQFVSGQALVPALRADDSRWELIHPYMNSRQIKTVIRHQLTGKHSGVHFARQFSIPSFIYNIFDTKTSIILLCYYCQILAFIWLILLLFLLNVCQHLPCSKIWWHIMISSR